MCCLQACSLHRSGMGLACRMLIQFHSAPQWSQHCNCTWSLLGRDSKTCQILMCIIINMNKLLILLISYVFICEYLSTIQTKYMLIVITAHISHHTKIIQKMKMLKLTLRDRLCFIWQHCFMYTVLFSYTTRRHPHTFTHSHCHLHRPPEGRLLQMAPLRQGWLTHGSG